MKNIRLYMIVSLLAMFAACENDFESKFDLSPDERTEIVLNDWKKELVSSEHGWISHYYPNPELLGGYTYIFKFNEDGTVKMDFGVRAIDPEKDVVESLYSLKMFEKPVLVFDTYSIFSKMSDPEPGIPGQGFGGENEYAFVKKSVEGDTLFLEERIGRDPLTLVKASATDWENIKMYPAMADQLIRRNEQIVPFYLNLSVDGWSTKVNMVFDDNMQKTRLVYTENGEAKLVEMPVNFTHEGFQFHHAFELDGIKVRSFKYNEALNQFDVADQGVTGAFKYESQGAAEIKGVVATLFAPDQFGAPSRYHSPKLQAIVDNFRPENPLGSFEWSAYHKGESDHRSFTFNFADWTGFEIKISEFEVISENSMRMHFDHYVLDGFNQQYSESEINAMMDSESAQALFDLFFSDKGWTIVPVFWVEFGYEYYVISNEDPEIYMYCRPL